MVEEKVAQEVRSPIDWPATMAGAAAAVTVAVLLSTLGAAGTLIGAALGSVVATVSTALYKQGIESSRRRMADVQAVALQKVNLADQDLRRAERRPAGPRAEQDVARARERLDEASSALEADAEQPDVAVGLVVENAPSRWAELPWRRIALLAAAVFVIAIAAISIAEVLAGKSVSTITGGTDGDDRTSITGVFGDDTGSEEPSDETTPTDSTTGPSESDSTSPTEESSTATTDATEPTPSGTPTETVTVTETATESTDDVEPTASATP